MSDNPTPKPTPPPWAWRKFGGTWHLVGDHGGRPVVLTANIDNRLGDWDPPGDAYLCVRDAEGRLVPLTPDHPDMRLIAQAPALLGACEALLADVDAYLARGHSLTKKEAGNVARMRDAAKKAKGD